MKDKQPKYHVFEQGPAELSAARELSSDEFHAVVSAARELHSYEQSADLFKLLESNSSAVEACLDEIFGKEAEGLLPRSLGLGYSFELNRLLINFLSSFRLYVDHQETRVKRKYGTDSSEAERYSKITSLVYDSEFAYRFCYKLRNYVQHCGWPFEGIRASSSSSTDTPGQLDEHSFSVQFDIPHLLKSFQKWGTVKKDLEQRPPKLEIRGFAPAVVKSVQHLESLVYIGEYDSLCSAGRKILAILDEDLKRGVPIQVGEVFTEGRKANVSLQGLPFPILHTLGLIELDRPDLETDHIPVMCRVLTVQKIPGEINFRALFESVPGKEFTGASRAEVEELAVEYLRDAAKAAMEQGIPFPPSLPWHRQHSLINKHTQMDV